MNRREEHAMIELDVTQSVKSKTVRMLVRMSTDHGERIVGSVILDGIDIPSRFSLIETVRGFRLIPLSSNGGSSR